MKKATNSWSEGLIMDFSPENTSPNCLTSALNATLITYNGNENMLLNDMGNGRIETAFLPEGFVPVGTCEYGDIIYIVSYNPLTNKSQIGCFPSPERNISSDEVRDLGQQISTDEFQEIKNNQLTGRLKNNSVRKILYEKLSPGDKYFIYRKGDDKSDDNDFKYFSDYLGDGLNSFSKYLKVHVVSIQDNGKIEFLDSNVKWYSDYFIPTIKEKTELKYDLDSYRDALQSGYSVFASKLSGKLGLLIELEKINGFNCTYTIVKDNSNTEPPLDYKVYWNINWDTDNNDVNPKYIVLTESKVDNKDINIPRPIFNEEKENNEEYYFSTISSSLKINDYQSYLDTNYNKSVEYYLNNKKAILDREGSEIKEGYYYLDIISKENTDNGPVYKDIKGGTVKSVQITDDIINNYFKTSVCKCFHSFPKGDYIYNYEITPAMPYGLLEEYAIKGSIDFSKIGTDYINLHTWKYYNTEDSITLTLGLDAYTEESKGIAGISLEFYDAYGLAAAYHINNKNSYSGTFTEYIPLNGMNLSNKLTSTDSLNNNILHKGLSLQQKGITTLKDGYLYEKEGQLYSIKIDASKGNLTTEHNIIYFQSENISENFYFILDDKVIYLKDLQFLTEEESKAIYFTINNKKVFINNENEDWITNINDINLKCILLFYDGNGTTGSKPLFSDIDNYYENDAGILYANALYGVKIIIKNCNIDSLGNFNIYDNSSFVTEYRWLWTNRLLNSNYNSILDFKDAVGDLFLDLDVSYKTNDKWTYDISKLSYPLQAINNGSEIYKNLAATVQEISGGFNIDSVTNFCIQDGYNTFTLNSNTLSDNFNFKVHLGESSIESNQGNVELTNTNKFSIFDGIYPIEQAVDDYSNKSIYAAKMGYLSYTNRELCINELQVNNYNSVPAHEYLYYGIDIFKEKKGDEGKIVSLVTGKEITKSNETECIAVSITLTNSYENCYTLAKDPTGADRIYLIKKYDGVTKVKKYNSETKVYEDGEADTDDYGYYNKIHSTDSTIYFIKLTNELVFLLKTINGIDNTNAEYFIKGSVFLVDEFVFKRHCDEKNYSKWSTAQCIYFDYLPNNTEIKCTLQSNYHIDIYKDFIPELSYNNSGTSGEGSINNNYITSLRPDGSVTNRFDIGNSSFNNDVLIGYDGIIGLPSHDTLPVPEDNNSEDIDNSTEIKMDSNFTVIVTGIENYNSLARCVTKESTYTYSFKIKTTKEEENARVIHFRIPLECRYTVKTEEGETELRFVDFNEHPIGIEIFSQEYKVEGLLPVNLSTYVNREGFYSYKESYGYLLGESEKPEGLINSRLLTNQSSDPIELLFISCNVVKPNDLLNTEKWKKFKNLYVIVLSNSYPADSTLNYLNYKQEEKSLPLGHLVYTQVIQNTVEPITVNLGLSALHYSKYYKETNYKYSALPVLEPLLNTILDLGDYNMGLDDTHLYFKLLIILGIGYGNAYHNFGSLYYPSDLKTIGKEAATFYNTQKGDSHMGITKISNPSTHYNLWDRGKFEDSLIKDHFNNICPVFFKNQNQTYNSITITLNLDLNNIVKPTPTFINHFIDKFTTNDNAWRMNKYRLNLPSSNGTNNFQLETGSDGDSINVCGFLMKDKNNNIHALNNLFPLFSYDQTYGLKNTGTISTLYIKYKSLRPTSSIQIKEYSQKVQEKQLPLTIADAAASVFSNIYKVSDKTRELEEVYTSNIVYLENQQSRFNKDVIYELSVKTGRPLSQNLQCLNIFGVTIETYRNEISRHLGMQTNEDFKNTLQIGINDIIKNVPLLFNFDYKSPELDVIFNNSKSVFIRKSDNFEYTTLPTDQMIDENNLYCLNKEGSLQKIYSYLPYKYIKEVESNGEGLIKFTYYDEVQEHKQFNNFVYKENKIILDNTNYIQSSVYDLQPTLKHNEVISGFVKQEYLTTLGKYAE